MSQAGSPNMARPHCLFPLLNLVISLFLATPRAQVRALTMKKSLDSNVAALYVFGDSTVDPGNNNYIATDFRSNFLPYGRDLANHKPTGRFSNGRLATDFIAWYLGIKEYVPPYLDPTLSMEELMTGFSTASAGTGYDPLTPQITNVISLPKQLDYFREYKRRLESKNGKKMAENDINKAVILVSSGTNDFIDNYFLLPIRRSNYSISDYQRFIIQHAKQFIQDLSDEGARRIAVVGLPPMGCLPLMITTFLSDKPFRQRSCVARYSSVARHYNRMLQLELNLLQKSLAHVGSKIYYVDIYNPLADMIRKKKHYGFEEVHVGCCGTGLVEAGPFCNPQCYVCPNASKNVFWDSIHPTERAYYNVFLQIRPVIDLIVKKY